MSFVLYFALAVGCGISASSQTPVSTYFVLELNKSGYEVVDRDLVKERENVRERDREREWKLTRFSWRSLIAANVNTKESEKYEKKQALVTERQDRSETYTYRDTGLTIWRDADSKLYIKDTGTGGQSRRFSLRIAGSTASEWLSSSRVLITAAKPTSIYIGAVFKSGDKEPFLYIFDFHPISGNGTLNFTTAHVRDFAESVKGSQKNGHLYGPLKSYISFLEYRDIYKNISKKGAALKIFVDDGLEKRILCFKNANQRVYLNRDLNILVSDNQLTINYKRKNGIIFESSVPRKLHRNGENYSIVFRYRNDDIYIGSFSYTGEGLNYRADFYLGLTSDNFHKSYRKNIGKKKP